MATSTKLLTIEEYAALPDKYDDFGQRLNDELIEGEILVWPRASRAHFLLNHRIARALRPLENFGYTVIVEGALPVKNAGMESVIGPDLMVVPTQQLYCDVDKSVYGSLQPLLAIEVVSPANRHASLMKKAQLMLYSGCAEVWIFAPEKNQVDVFTSAGFRTESHQLRIPAPGLNLVLSVAPIFDFSMDVQPAHNPDESGATASDVTLPADVQ